MAATATKKTAKQPKTTKKKQVKKSKFALYWENPNAKPLISEIIDMRAVLKWDTT